MIIRKPYAFLMKYFRKIHILILALGVFIFYKTSTFYSFVKQYMTTGVYNPYIESVKHYASDFLYLALILIIAILVTIVILLKRKKKPIVDYLIVIGEYAFVFIIFIIGARYFNNLDDALIIEKDIRLVRDLLLIGSIPQYITFVWVIIRILGIDLNRFGFKQDEEFNEISEEDREEVEVAVEVDKDVYKRELKKRIRFLKYYYKENTFILNIIISIIFIALVTVISISISQGDKTYKEKRTFNANNYSITINDSYISKYDKSGNIIEKNSSFVIIDVSVENNSESRIMDIEKFLLVSNKYKYVPTLKYNESFKDLGNGYVKKELKKDSTNRFLLIYKVDNKMLDKKIILYYQNVRGGFDFNYYKIKLNPDVYNNQVAKEKSSLNKTLDINDKKIKITNFEIGNTYPYLHRKCDVNGCYITSDNLITTDKKIIKLDIDTNDFDGSSFIDFLDTYGKIIYRVDGKEKKYEIYNPITVKYNGNSSFLIVNNDITTADQIYLSITIRNNTYKYYLKGDEVDERNTK